MTFRKMSFHEVDAESYLGSAWKPGFRFLSPSLGHDQFALDHAPVFWPPLYGFIGCATAFVQHCSPDADGFWKGVGNGSEHRFDVIIHGQCSVSPLQTEFRNNLVTGKDLSNVSHFGMQGCVEGAVLLFAAVRFNSPVHGVGGDVAVWAIAHPDLGAAVVQALGVQGHGSILLSAEQNEFGHGGSVPPLHTQSRQNLWFGLDGGDVVLTSEQCSVEGYEFVIRMLAHMPSDRASFHLAVRTIVHPDFTPVVPGTHHVQSHVLSLPPSAEAFQFLITEKTPESTAAGRFGAAHGKSVGECKTKIQPQDIGAVDCLRVFCVVAWVIADKEIPVFVTHSPGASPAAVHRTNIFEDDGGRCGGCDSGHTCVMQGIRSLLSACDLTRLTDIEDVVRVRPEAHVFSRSKLLLGPMFRVSTQPERSGQGVPVTPQFERLCGRSGVLGRFGNNPYSRGIFGRPYGDFNGGERVRHFARVTLASQLIPERRQRCDTEERAA